MQGVHYYSASLYLRGPFWSVPLYEPCPGQWLARSSPGGWRSSHWATHVLHYDFKDGAPCTIEPGCPWPLSRGHVVKVWDIFDVQQVIQTAVLEGVLQVCVKHESHWAAWTLSTMAAIFLSEALLLYSYSRGRHPYAPKRFGRRSIPLWVRPLLAFALLTVAGAAPRQPPPPFRDKTSRTFWCEDGSMQEQLAAAEAAYPVEAS